MATPISLLPAATTFGGTERVPLVQGGATKYGTPAQQAAYTFTGWGALVAAGTSKATPVDGDSIALSDSAAAGATKRLTWANLKATLEAYFDTQYAAAAGAVSTAFDYTSDTGSTADSDPGAGLFKWNNATQASATHLFIDDATTGGVDLSAFFTALPDDGYIRLIQNSDPTKWQLWQWTAKSDDTGYFDFTVTLLANSGAIADNEPTSITFDADPPSAGGGAVDVQTFSADGTWTKPAGCTLVKVVCIGAGGGGGGGGGIASGTRRDGGAGGGGGARAEKIFQAADLSATEDVVIGVGGTAGTGGTSGSGTAGADGTDSTFGGVKCAAFGGGGGRFGDTAASGHGGGGGGGTGGRGATGDTGSVLGGAPALVAGAAGTGGQGGGGVKGNGGHAEYGGGGGGGAGAGAGPGGSSIYGGSGGGGGGTLSSGNAPFAAGDGGRTNGYGYAVGSGNAGAAKGNTSGSAGTAGANATTIQTGGGGGGGGCNASGTGGAGGAGGTGGGGGGGGGAGTPTGGAGGNGGRGEVRVYSW